MAAYCFTNSGLWTCKYAGSTGRGELLPLGSRRCRPELRLHLLQVAGAATRGETGAQGSSCHAVGGALARHGCLQGRGLLGPPAAQPSSLPCASSAPRSLLSRGASAFRATVGTSAWPCAMQCARSCAVQYFPCPSIPRPPQIWTQRSNISHQVWCRHRPTRQDAPPLSPASKHPHTNKHSNRTTRYSALAGLSPLLTHQTMWCRKCSSSITREHARQQNCIGCA